MEAICTLLIVLLRIFKSFNIHMTRRNVRSKCSEVIQQIWQGTFCSERYRDVKKYTSARLRMGQLTICKVPFLLITGLDLQPKVDEKVLCGKTLVQLT